VRTPFQTSAFAAMPALAERHGAVDLGTGAPDFGAPPDLVEAAVEALRADASQYSPSVGNRRLREAIAAHQREHYQLEVDPAAEVAVFCGATEALAAAMLGLLDPGDEVILFEPFYPSYPVCAALAGAAPRYVTLRAPGFSFDPDELRAAFGSRTRLLVLNTPSNPTGRVLRPDELAIIARLCQEHDVLVIADEVYQHITFDGRHVPIATLPGMRERTLTLGSASKTFSATGWRVGWAVGPAPLVAAAQTTHQYLTFCAPAPLQAATATALDGCRGPFLRALAGEYAARRELLLAGLRRAGFQVAPPEGAYYLIGDYAEISGDDDRTFCGRLVEQWRVAAIPLSGFYRPGSPEVRQRLRFAFCKRSETLQAASERLAGLAAPVRR
jgi:N-succinyldiaminopimelate aminotransferase